jgi:DNA repair protein RecO (recombination protein O)
MPLHESEAIVLQSYSLGEADRLVSFLSRNKGRVRGVARGARRPKSRFGSTLERLSHIRVWFFERETRELVRINQCELIESFLEAHGDYPSSVALALFSEITEAVLPDREPSDASFRLLLLAAKSIKQTKSTALPLAYFTLWTVKLGGWLPSLKNCVRCSRELDSEVSFVSGAYMGITCAKCRMPSMRKFSNAAILGARMIAAQRLEQLGEQKLSPESTGEVTNYMLDLIEHQLERRLTTRSMLEPTP